MFCKYLVKRRGGRSAGGCLHGDGRTAPLALEQTRRRARQAGHPNDHAADKHIRLELDAPAPRAAPARACTHQALPQSAWRALRHQTALGRCTLALVSRQRPGGRRNDAARPRSAGSQTAGRKQGAHWPVLTASGPALAMRWSGSGAARSSSGASGPLWTSASLGGPWWRARGQVREARAACSCQAWTRDSRSHARCPHA